MADSVPPDRRCLLCGRLDPCGCRAPRYGTDWLPQVDALTARGVDAFLAVVEADPR